MKKFLKTLGMLAGLAALFVLTVILLRPLMDRWGASEAEIAATFPGDGLTCPGPGAFHQPRHHHPGQPAANLPLAAANRRGQGRLVQL